MGFVVAVDGPAGSGKGTVTKLIGKKKKLIYVDTGAMYRCITLYMLKNNINIEDKQQIEKMLETIDIELKQEEEKQIVYLNNEDVTNKIRTKEINQSISDISKIKEVREKLVLEQRKIGENQDIIMEGRDIGTIVFPNADVKIYLDASTEERAKRRLKQNIEAKMQGNDIEYEKILENVKRRDFIDSTREISPLKKAEDAIYIDSSNLSIEEVVEKISEIIDKKISEKGIC